MELNRELYIDGVSDYLENGKNIFDKGSLYVYKTIINPITITEQNTGIKIDYTATDIFSGAFVLYNLGLASKYAGKPITCSADVVLNSNTRGKLTIGLISNDGSTRNILQNGEEITSNTNGYSVSATIPSTISSSTPYLGVWVYFNNNATGSVSIEYSNLQVEEGLGATPYEPHKKYITKQYLEQQENLYNSSTDTTNSYINSEGEVISLSTWRVTDYIPVTPGSTFYYEGLINTGVAPYSAFYNSSKQFVSSFKQVQGINNIVVPSGISYIRFSLNNSDVRTFKFDNRSYYGKYASKDCLENGLNLFDGTWERGSINNSGANVSSDTSIRSNYVSIAPNTSYYFSSNTSSSVSELWANYYNNGTFVSREYLGVTNSKNFTTPAGANQVRFRLSFSSTVSANVISYVMLNKGSTELPYEKYYGKYLNKADGILIPYTLYYNSSGSTGNITLSDDASNYKFLEIYFGASGSANDRMDYVKVDLSLSNNVSLFKFSSDAGGSLYAQCRDVTISGTTISTLDNTRYWSASYAGSSWSKTATNSIYIRRVIGYK